MKIVTVDVRDIGTAAKRRPSTTAGLVSGYQRTNITTSGASYAETAGGDILAEMVTLPFPIPFIIQPDLKAKCHGTMEEGYKEMFDENDQLAEASLKIATEVWPAWEA